VRAVSASASQLRTTPRAFLGDDHWQVFYGDTLLPEGYPGREVASAAGRRRHRPKLGILERTET
jgi:hypothetical protein